MARAKNAGKKDNTTKNKQNGANVGYEAELWRMAGAFQGSMDAAKNKHVVLGLIFLKYISGSSKCNASRTPARQRLSFHPRGDE